MRAGCAPPPSHAVSQPGQRATTKWYRTHLPALAGRASRTHAKRAPRLQVLVADTSVADTSGSGGQPKKRAKTAKKPAAKKKVASGSDSGHRQWPLAMLAGGSANRYSASIILTPEQILATWAGHMGWPNGMATRDLDGVAPEQCALSTGATVAIESVHICIEPKRWLAQHRCNSTSAATHPHTATTINFGYWHALHSHLHRIRIELE